MAPEKNRRINEEILDPKVSVISEEGEPIGTLSREEAIHLAESKELDLVEIGKKDGIALAKIMDYGKFLFKQQKNQAQSRQSSKKADVKTIKITYKIGDHDLEIRRNQAFKFAEAGHPLKLALTLRGRENHYEALAMDKMKEFIASLEEAYKTSDVKVAKTGNNFSAVLYPKK